MAATPTSVKLYWPEDLDKKGKQIPLSAQISGVFNYVEKEAGLKFVVVNLPWKRAQQEVLQGNGIIYGFSKTAKRLEQYRFSPAVTTLHIWTISYGAANSRIAELNDLAGKTITSGLGLTHGLEYDQARNRLFTVQEDYVSGQDRYKKLLTKQSDIILMPAVQQLTREQLEHFVNQTVIPGFNDPAFTDKHFELSSRPIFYDTIHFASGKGKFAEVMDRIDKAIQKGSKNGALAIFYRPPE